MSLPPRGSGVAPRRLSLPVLSRRACPVQAQCPMVERLRAAGTLQSWQIRYCGGDYGACIRYRMQAAGQPVPENLLPDGQMLRFSGAFKLSG